MSSTGLATPSICPSFSSPRATAYCRRPSFLIPKVKASRWSVAYRSTRLVSRRFRQVRGLCSEQDEKELEIKLGIQKDSDAELSLGVTIALAMLNFYKNEISPFLPGSCRFVPSCSEYSMQAYKKYGVVKGTILTAWRLLRCNPLGPSGYDPPRWFGESRPPQVEEDAQNILHAAVDLPISRPAPAPS